MIRHDHDNYLDPQKAEKLIFIKASAAQDSDDDDDDDEGSDDDIPCV